MSRINEHSLEQIRQMLIHMPLGADSLDTKIRLACWSLAALLKEKIETQEPAKTTPIFEGAEK